MIQAYSVEWTNRFQKEANLIKETLGNLIEDIQHIGSTSIPGLASKPIIDIAVLVQSISNPRSFTQILEKIGYVYKPDMSSGERIFLRKGDPVAYHLSISEPKYSYWSRQILFRDYLRNHPEAAEEYQNIKYTSLQKLPKEDLKDLSISRKYNEDKAPFVEKILKLAKG